MRLLHTFKRSERGNTSILFALSAVPLVALAGGTVDIAKQRQHTVHVQSALDAAALAAARELADQAAENGFGDFDYESAEDRASAIFIQTIAPHGLSAELTVAHEGTRIMAEAAVEMPTAFLPLIGVQSLPINALSEADFEGAPATCVYVTAPIEPGVTLFASSKFNADCDVWVESTNLASISGMASSDMEATGICSNGGTVLRATSTVTPEPSPCVKPFNDPLANLARPSEASGACQFTDLTLKGIVHLRPGVYCGTTSIEPSSRATFEPGVYVFRDGELSLGSGTDAAGEDILFFFEGRAAGLKIGDGAHFEGHGRQGGAFAGLIVYVDRDCLGCATTVKAGGTAALEGTVYAPTARFSVQSRASTVAAPAAMFIVYQIDLSSSADFSVASNFDGSVPAAYADAARLRLVK